MHSTLVAYAFLGISRTQCLLHDSKHAQYKQKRTPELDKQAGLTNIYALGVWGSEEAWHANAVDRQHGGIVPGYLNFETQRSSFSGC